MTDSAGGNVSAAGTLDSVDIVVFCVLTAVGYAVGLYFSFNGRRSQYLRMRFDNKVGITSCVVYFILSESVGAVGMFSSAIALSTMFPVPLVYSNIAIGLAGTIYTALGGLRGVVWADCAQAVVMVMAPIVIIGKVFYDSTAATPPLRPISEVNITNVAFRMTLDLTNEENFWSGLAGAVPFSLVRTGFDQMAVQRFMAARTLRDAKRIALAGPLFVLVFFFLGDCTGLAMIYWFRDCDPLLRGAIKSYDQIIPYYMVRHLADMPMLRGLFLAGLVGASTSTVSSIVNSHAAIFYIDVVTPYVKISEQKSLIVMRLLAFTSGTIMTLCAIAVPYLGTAARLFMSFYCSVAGPFTGLFLLALSSPWVNAKGAGCATLLVCVFLLWHAIGRSLSDIAPPPYLPRTLDRCPLATNTSSWMEEPLSGIDQQRDKSSSVFRLYLVSFYWISFIGALMTMFLGTALSLVTGGCQEARANMRFTSPVFLNFWKRFRFLRRTFKLQGDEMRTGVAVLQLNGAEEGDEELGPLKTELTPMNKESECFGRCTNELKCAEIIINQST